MLEDAVSQYGSFGGSRLFDETGEPLYACWAKKAIGISAVRLSRKNHSSNQ